MKSKSVLLGIERMYNETKFDLNKRQIEEGARDLKEVKFILDRAALVPNSLEDEIDELFRELAALKGKSVTETVEEIKYGILQYLEVVVMPEPDTNSPPEMVDFCYEQMKKLSISIESCWDFFSEERRDLFIQIASYFRQKGEKRFKGWRGLSVCLELLIPSILSQKNLFAKLKKSFFFIPEAVERAVALRQGKGTNRFSSVVESIVKQILEEQKRQPSLLSSLKHLGRDREEQIQKNQAAMAWAKARMKEIEEKRDRNRVEM